MSLLQSHLHETATWLAAVRNEDGTSRTDGSGRTAYSQTRQTIACRKEEKFRMILNSRGVEVTSSGNILTMAEVMPDDKIDGKLVIAVQKMKDLTAQDEGRRAYLQ